MTSAPLPSPNEDRDRIAANFRAEMARSRWSQRAVASALGLTQPYVARRASGEVELSGSDIALFARHLNVPVSVFFADHPQISGGETFLGVTPLKPRLVGRTGLEPVTDGLWVAPVTPIRRAQAS